MKKLLSLLTLATIFSLQATDVGSNGPVAGPPVSTGGRVHLFGKGGSVQYGPVRTLPEDSSAVKVQNFSLGSFAQSTERAINSGAKDAENAARNKQT